jgi:hypothetical protein
MNFVQSEKIKQENEFFCLSFYIFLCQEMKSLSSIIGLRQYFYFKKYFVETKNLYLCIRCSGITIPQENRLKSKSMRK